MSENSNELIFSSIRTLLALNIGFSIGLFAMLSIRQLESLEFSVEYEDPQNVDDSWEKLFDDVDEAIRFFQQMRAQLGLGFDYETIE